MTITWTYGMGIYRYAFGAVEQYFFREAKGVRLTTIIWVPLLRVFLNKCETPS